MLSTIMPSQKFYVGVKAMIINEKNEILVLRVNAEEMKERQYDHWDLPGGRIKDGETFEMALRREVNEELGINEIEILEHFDTQISNMKIPTASEWTSLLMVTYRCRLQRHDIQFKLSSEHLEYKWANISEAKELLKVKFANSFIDKLDTLKL